MMDATPLLRLHAARRGRILAAQDPVAAQRRQLQHLLAQGRATRFGREHGFASIRSVADYQARVPLRRYEDFWREYWQPVFPVLQGATWPDRVPFLALSSGTTAGASKYIPVTGAMVRANRRAALDILVHHVRNHPGSRVLAGRSFMLGGTTALRDEGHGVRSGDLSGIATITVPPYARARTFPPADLALIAGWDEKIARIAEPSLAADIRAISGTPSWLLLFFEQLARLHPGRPRRLARFYPDLELLVHGGVPYGAYAARMAAWLEGSRVTLREAYAASEGFIAMADRGPGEGLRMELDNGLFHEFVPLAELDAANPTRHWIGNAETGIEYALVLTSNAGLWSYVIGDTVRLVDRDPPRLLVTGRTSYFLSAFGEHVSAGEIERAVLGAGAHVAEFAAGAIHADAGEGDRHVLVVEFAQPPAAPEAFARRVDEALIAGNDDYRAHREGGQMLPPLVEAMRPGGFAAWMHARGRLGGQNKVPRIITDPALLASLRDFARD
jgi:hypothetical protein